MTEAGTARTPLNAERIVAAALELIDAEGLEQLSIRRLGEALGVQGMALYRHMASKDEILDGVRKLLVGQFAERLATRGPLPDWRSHLLAFAECYRAVARAHPRAFPLLATGAEKAWAYGRDIAGAALASLLDAGFDEATAIGAERTIIRYVIGFSLIDAANLDTPASPTADLAEVERSHPIVGKLLRSIEPADEELFLLGVALILDGLAARLASFGGRNPQE